MCSHRLTLKEQKIFTFEEPHTQKTCAATSKNTDQWLGFDQLKSIKHLFELFHASAFRPTYIPRNCESQIINDCIHFIYKLAPWKPHNIGLFHVNIPYWMPQIQHSSSGQQIAKLYILSNIIDWVYTAFFYGDYTQQMQSLPEETLFCQFCNHLKWYIWNWACTGGWRLWQWSESFNIPHLSAEHQESTMSQQWKNYPWTLYILYKLNINWIFCLL